MPRLLFVSHNFPPDASIGSRRARRIAIELTARGWDVDVLAAETIYQQGLDPATLTGLENVHITRTHALNPRKWAQRARDAVRAMRGGTEAAGMRNGGSQQNAAGPSLVPQLLSVLSRTYADLEVPDSFAGWFVPALATAANFPRPDIVFASLPWFTNALVGLAVANLHDAPLFFDYRDPWNHPGRTAQWPAWRRGIEAQLEAACIQRCAGFTAVTEGIADHLRGRTTMPVNVVYNAADPADFATVTPRIFHAPTLLYTGALSGGRRIEPLLDALATAPSGPNLHYMGWDHAHVLAAAAERGLKGRVTADGLRPHVQAAAAMLGARANVCIIGPEHHIQVPGKLYEQLACGRPVLVLGPPGCDAARIARPVANARVANLADPTAIAQAIANLPDTKRPIGAPAGLSVTETMDALHTALLAALLAPSPNRPTTATGT